MKKFCAFITQISIHLALILLLLFYLSQRERERAVSNCLLKMYARKVQISLEIREFWSKIENEHVRESLKLSFNKSVMKKKFQYWNTWKRSRAFYQTITFISAGA